MKKVKYYMHRKVIKFSPKDSVFEVARVFGKSNISGAPVVIKNRVVGVISISDIVKFMSLRMSTSDIIAHDPQSISLMLINLVKMGKDYIDFKKDLDRISKTEIEHMMSKNVIGIDPDENLFEAATLMEKYDINRLPVIKNKKLVGIIARKDLVEALID